LTEKEKTYKEQENEKRLGKKRFLERMVEDEEAQQLIQDFLDKPEQEETLDERDPTRPFS
jgi:hypothetical protein